MRPKVLEEIPTSDAPSAWEGLGATYVPMGLAVQTHQRTREEYAGLLLMAWPCE